LESSGKLNKEPIRDVFRFILRFVASYILVVSFFYVAGNLYAKMLLPVFAYQIEFLKPEYEVRSFGIENINKVNEIYYVVKINRLVPNLQGVYRYGKEVKIATVASVLYIPPIIVFSLVLSWTGLSIRERLKSALISMFFLVVIASVDLPILLISRIEKGFGLESASGQVSIFMYHFLGNGGRQFFAVLGFFMSIGFLSIFRYSKMIPHAGRNDPCPCGSGKKYKNCCMS